MRGFVRAILLALMLCIPAQAFAQSDPCLRPHAGGVVRPPPDLYSANGVLQFSLNYFTGLDNFNRTLFCFVTPTGMESPTLHVRPGDTIKIALTNMVTDGGASAETVSGNKTRCGAKTMTPASLNMHFHGTNTAPVCHSDEVIHTLVNSGQTFTYNLHIPSNEPPGLYWYHPHVHGMVEAAVQGGASGAIVVEGIAKIQPALRGLPQRILVVRDQPLAHPPKTSQGGETVPDWDLSLNYVPIRFPRDTPSVLYMHAGQPEFWRVVNASADTVADLRLEYDGVVQPLQIVGLDGVPTGSHDGKQHGTIITVNDILIPPAGRAEFIATGPSTGVQNATLWTLNIDTGRGSVDTKRPLATIKTTNDPNWLPPGIERSVPQKSLLFDNLADAKVTDSRRLYLSEILLNSQNKYFITVNGQEQELYNPDSPPAIITHKGAVEDWTIENRTREVHEFHMHQIHFLLLAVNGVPVPKDQQQFYDTHQVGYWTGKGPYPSIKVRMDFRGAVVGEFVYECHILGHEDHGMMANIRVLPEK